MDENDRDGSQYEDRILDSLNDCMASDVLDIRDPEELEVYGNQKQAGVQITSYIFEVCDSLINIGPCGNISIGEPAFLSEEFNNNPDLDLELVTTAGHSKNGALCVLQKTIRPQIVTTFTLPGCSNMWTVRSGEERHAFLILSQEDGTMVRCFFLCLVQFHIKLRFKNSKIIVKHVGMKLLLIPSIFF